MRSAVAIFLLVLVLGCDTSSNVQGPNKNYFVKYFGGDGNQRAVGLIVNDDGTFYILGNSRSSTAEPQRVYLAKVNAVGDTIWQTTYPPDRTVSPLEMDARDFKVANGSIVVVANRKANPTSTNSDIQLIQFRLDNGDTVQSKVLQLDPALTGSTHYNTWANSLTVMNDGGFLVAGYTDYSLQNKIDALHFRTDASLNQKLITSIWQSTNGQGLHNFAVGAFQTEVDSTYVFGYTDGPSQLSIDEDFWAFSVNSKGYPGGVSNYVVNNSNDEMTHALKATQGGYLLTGLAIDNGQNFSLKMSKIRFNNLSFDITKDVQFTFAGKSLGTGTEKYATACNSATGYFALTNYFNTTAGNSDILLLKLDLSLQDMWNDHPVLLGGDGDDTAAAVAELPDGHIMVLGTINLGNPPEQFKIALMKLNSAGKLSD